MNIILAGFQGVGKTSCGRLLAAKLNFSFVDTDELLCSTYGTPTARALYQSLGEKDFRELEGVLLQNLQTCKKSVIALGGGSLFAPNADTLVPQLGKLFYLYLPLEELLADRSRFCAGAFVTEEGFKEHYLQRHAIFSRLCHERIDVQNLDFDGIVNKLF